MSCNENECTTSQCDTESKKSSDCCTIAEDLLCLAKQAKHEVLKEKMKKEIEAKLGKKLDNIAKIVVEAGIAYMEHEFSGKEACNSYKEKLYAAFKS